MPRQLALLLCSLFVFYLLRYDRRQPNRSWVLWIPTLWMLVITSRSIDTWLGVSGGDRMSGGVLDPFFQGGLLCTGSIILLKRQLNWSEVVKNNAWLIVLIGYMLVSILWSDLPARSFRSWIKEIVAVIMALVVFTEAMPRQALESILRRTVYILIPFSILLVKYYPNVGVIYGRWSGEIQWIGVALQKNSLGQLCLVSTFFLVWTLTRRWQGRDRPVAKYQTGVEVLLLIITLWLLKGPSMWAASATSIVTLSFGLATFFALLWMNKRRIRLGAGTCMFVIACIIVFGTLTPLVGGFTATTLTSALGRDSTLTGRTDIWAGLLPLAEQRPILGSGFGALWTPETIAAGTGVNEAHNGYLEVLLQLGSVGLLLTAMFLLSCGRKAQQTLAYDFDWGRLGICFLLMAAIHNISESSFDSFTRQLMAIILFLSVSVRTATRRPQSQEHRPVPVDGFADRSFQHNLTGS